MDMRMQVIRAMNFLLVLKVMGSVSHQDYQFISDLWRLQVLYFSKGQITNNCYFLRVVVEVSGTKNAGPLNSPAFLFFVI